MKLLYEPNDAIEGQLLVNGLQQAGVVAYLHGAGLSGVIGEVPAFGLVRIMVHEQDYQQAREILEELLDMELD